VDLNVLNVRSPIPALYFFAIPQPSLRLGGKGKRPAFKKNGIPNSIALGNIGPS
jgi:hypothetical protein